MRFRGLFASASPPDVRNGCAFPLARPFAGLRPCFRFQHNFDLKVGSDTVEKLFRRLFYHKGVAQKSELANGKAQPFLTSGGEENLD